MSCDLVQLPLDHKAEMVEVEIVLIVVERIFNLLSNFEETEEQERCESGRGDGQVFEAVVDLERQKEQIEPQRDSQMRLIRKRQRGIPDPLQVVEGILQGTNIVDHSCSNGGL